MVMKDDVLQRIFFAHASSAGKKYLPLSLQFLFRRHLLSNDPHQNTLGWKRGQKSTSR